MVCWESTLTMTATKVGEGQWLRPCRNAFSHVWFSFAILINRNFQPLDSDRPRTVILKALCHFAFAVPSKLPLTKTHVKIRWCEPQTNHYSVFNSKNTFLWSFFCGWFFVGFFCCYLVLLGFLFGLGWGFFKINKDQGPLLISEL